MNILEDQAARKLPDILAGIAGWVYDKTEITCIRLGASLVSELSRMWQQIINTSCLACPCLNTVCPINTMMALHWLVLLCLHYRLSID